MAKIKNESKDVITLKNNNKKYNFILQYKYNMVFLTILKRNTSNFHVGTFKFKDIEEIKYNNNILQYLQLEDIEEFFNNFKY